MSDIEEITSLPGSQIILADHEEQKANSVIERQEAAVSVSTKATHELVDREPADKINKPLLGNFSIPIITHGSACKHCSSSWTCGKCECCDSHCHC
jgi:hypothetical protein